LLSVRQDSVRDWQSWRDMHPILLRSTGLVGLAVAVVAIVSDQSFVSEPHAQTQSEIVVAAVRTRPVDATVGTVGTALPARAAPVSGPAADTAASRPSAPYAADSLSETGGVAADVEETEGALPASNKPAATVPASASEAAPSGASDPDVLTAALMPSPDRFAVETPEPPKKASLWPEAATECPRDWVAVESNGAAADHATGCENAPAVADQIGPAAAPALTDAVTERATQVAGLQFAPRLPQARPKPPR
jgi:hypothetical protein